MPSTSVSSSVPVLVAGGGPVGMTLAALLSRRGIASLVVEADDGYCTGSRAICISRRSLEVLSWAGAAQHVLDIGLAWTGGRSYFRDEEVLHFRMPSEPTERFAPMVNIQQYEIEEAAHRAIDPALGTVRWSTRVVDLRPDADGVDVDLVDAEGATSTVRAGWVVACDGGRSTVRERLGLALEGTQYEGRYVIVDIEQRTRREVERLAWFDPPSNPGSTILMHRQPHDVWRIDYQIRDDEDPLEAVKPEHVLPRVQSHLSMIGEDAPWTPQWISIYNAKCLTLPSYRRDRVLFAGDAAHLVPIFGVRGLNSGIDDAGNLAWKLAHAVEGRASDALLDSYSIERVHAARENIAHGAKSTEFMAPPHAGFALMRDAALRLALESEPVRSLINPRQTTPIAYVGSPLVATDDAWSGRPAPEAAVRGAVGHLTELFGDRFVLLAFGDARHALDAMDAVDASAMRADTDIWRIDRDGEAHDRTLVDAHGEAWSRYDARDGTVVLVRPDGYVMARWDRIDRQALADASDRMLRPTDEARHVA